MIEEINKGTRSNWKSVKYIVDYAFIYLANHPEQETLPGGHQLRAEGEEGFATAIEKYYGGFPKFRELIERARQSNNVSPNYWPEFEWWNLHGERMEYSERNSTSLERSENLDERQWHKRGESKKWLKKFSFAGRARWGDFENWREHGLDKGYNNRNPNSMKKSKNEAERRWFYAGKGRRDWVKMFEFKRMGKVTGNESIWPNFSTWEQVGIDKGYNKRNPGGLRTSDEKEERSWYGRGKRKNWLKDFVFSANGRINSGEKLITFLEKDRIALRLAAISLALNGEATDVEGVILDVYDGKFKDQTTLHRLLSVNRDVIGELLSNGIVNLGAYIGEFSLDDRGIIPVLLGEAILEIPGEKITPTLEEKLIRVQRSQMGPRFNDDPEGVLSEIEDRVSSSEGGARAIYQKLHDHYQQVLALGEEL